MNTFSYPNPPRIRRVVLEDSDFLIALAAERYDKALDYDACKHWIAHALGAPNEVFFCRSDHAAGVACVQRPFHDPASLDAFLVYLVALPNHGMEGYRMAKAMAEWARSKGASLHLGSSTDYDLGPFARRLGATMDAPSWTIPAPNPQPGKT